MPLLFDIVDMLSFNLDKSRRTTRQPTSSPRDEGFEDKSTCARMHRSCCLLLIFGSLSSCTAPSATTPLTFVHADPAGPYSSRHAVAHRLLSNTSGRMHGNLFSRGYFAANVCLGTGSGRRSFDLIVDTGSQLTALPCRDCSQCGMHMHDVGTVRERVGARFDVKASPTAVALKCGTQPAGTHCRSCSHNTCGYEQSYTEGSTIRGRLVTDLCHFRAVSGEEHPVRATFGCQTYESGLFFKQVADGIAGFAPGGMYGPTLFDSLRAGQPAAASSSKAPTSDDSYDSPSYDSPSYDTGQDESGSRAKGYKYVAAAPVRSEVPNVFSICLASEVGALTLGGALSDATIASSKDGTHPNLKARDHSKGEGSQPAVWVPYQGGYELKVADFLIEGVSAMHSQYRGGYYATVDSGTSFMCLGGHLSSTLLGGNRPHIKETDGGLFSS